MDVSRRNVLPAPSNNSEVRALTLFFSMGSERIERRQWPRLPLKLSVQFDSTEPDSEARGSGDTENVSAGGVYFLTSYWQELSPGMKLNLELSGFSQYNVGLPFTTLSAVGTLLRLDLPEAEQRPYGKAGAAVRFDERPEMDLYKVLA